jgi:hypothetical protein
VAFRFRGELFHWRGPSPYHFVAVPAEECAELRTLAAEVSYGWGMVPVTVRVGGSTWTTSLWPKDGGYVLPVKDSVRTAEGLAEGGALEVTLEVRA